MEILNETGDVIGYINKEEQKIKELYLLEKNMFFKFVKNKNKFTLDIRKINEEVKLLKSYADQPFYRMVKKSTNQIVLPEFENSLFIENNQIINFKINKEKLNLWKQI